MKDEKITFPAENTQSQPGSDPVNQYKKNQYHKLNHNSIDNIIKSAVEKTKVRTGHGLANEGTIENFDEER